jgi:hypothetical protein
MMREKKHPRRYLFRLASSRSSRNNLFSDLKNETEGLTLVKRKTGLRRFKKIILCNFSGIITIPVSYSRSGTPQSKKHQMV